MLKTRLNDRVIDVSISDTGHGVSAAHLPKLFEPFFTTKNEGLGLGLAIARSIVEAHAGKIWADGGESGATFHVTLPTAKYASRRPRSRVASSSLVVAQTEAVQHLVPERDGPVVVDERAGHPHDEHVANPFAGLGAAPEERETVQVAREDVVLACRFA